MMRLTEKELEKKRKKKGGSNEGKIGWNEDKKFCPFDDKKVCPVTKYFPKNMFFGICKFFGNFSETA